MPSCENEEKEFSTGLEDPKELTERTLPAEFDTIEET